MPALDPRPLPLALHLVYALVGSWWPARRLRRAGVQSRPDEAQLRAGGLDGPLALAAGFGRQGHVALAAVFGNWPLPIRPLEARAARGAGLALAAGGMALAALAAHQLGPSWRVGVDPDRVGALQTGGAYRWTRNPVILGEEIVLAGTFLLVPNALGVLVLAASVPASLRIARAEEGVLRARHGRAFDDYASRTPRFLPRLRLGSP